MLLHTIRFQHAHIYYYSEQRAQTHIDAKSKKKGEFMAIQCFLRIYT